MQTKIDNLIAKKLSGNASDAEQVELDSWIKASPENLAIYEETQRMWHLSGSLRAPEEPVNIDAAWQEFKTLSVTKKINRFSSRFYLKAAAVLFMVLLAVVIMRVLVSEQEVTPVMAVNVGAKADTFLAPEPQSLIVQAETVSVPDATVSAPVKRSVRKAPQVVMIAVSSEDSAMAFTLPDNTLVYLNTNSKLVYPEKFTAGAREVFLSGEAYFEPAAGATDFYIYCHETRTRAMGSALNIKGLRDGVVEISAITGSLEVNRKDDNASAPMRIKSGEQLRYDTATHKVSKSSVSRRDKWWKHKNFRTRIKDFFSRILPGKSKSKNKR